MQSEVKINVFQRYDLSGVSKKNCSDIVTSTNNQSVLIATNKVLYKLQFLDGKYVLNHVKISSKNEDEEFHLLATCSINKTETFIYACTRVDAKEVNQIMVFRNDFKDLVDTIHLDFKPILMKHIVYNESIYTLVCGEAINTLFMLTSQKDKKLSLVKILDTPPSLSTNNGVTSLDYFIEKKQMLYISLGFFDGTTKLLGFPIETEDKANEKQTPKFFVKQPTIQEETNLQLPISSVNIKRIEEAKEETLSLVASSSLGYLLFFNDVIKNKLGNPSVLSLKSETQLDTIMDCVLFDIDDDGEKEIIAVTYLSDLSIIKKEENSLRVVVSKEIDACFYNIYVEKQGERKFIILCGDNEVKILEVVVDK